MPAEPTPSADADLSLAQTVRITTGERPTVSPSAPALDPDEVETLDIATLRGRPQPVRDQGDRVDKPDWFANGPHAGDGSNDQPRTGTGFGAIGPAPVESTPPADAATRLAPSGPRPAEPRPPRTDRGEEPDAPTGEMSEEDRAATTEVLDLDAEAAARVAAEQERSGGAR